jgi:hypothetical protein
MDKQTQNTLKNFQAHLKIKRFLTKICYALILGGVFIYIFYGVNSADNIKIVSEFKENPQNFSSEKIMTNPRIKLMHSDGEIYDIKALQASHRDENAVILQDVFAIGNIGQISAGELKIDEAGDHLVFTKNPILILNKTGNLNDK